MFGVLNNLDLFANTCTSIWYECTENYVSTKNVDFYILEPQKCKMNENCSEIHKNFAP